MVVSDPELLVAARRGDPEAYGKLYDRYREMAQRFAASKLLNRSEAEDVVAEVFAATLAALGNGRGPVESFAPYLMSSLRNQCYRLNRQSARDTDVADLGAHEAAIGLHAHRDPYVQVDEVSVVRDAFQSLPPRFQDVLWRLEVDDTSHKELSHRYRATSHSVSVLARRARRAFGTAYLAQHLAIEASTGQLDDECRTTRPSLAAYVRGSLSTRRRRRVENHLQTCANCRQAHAELGQLNHHLRAMPFAPALLATAGASSASGVTTSSLAVSAATQAGSWSGAAPLAAASLALIVGVGPTIDRRHNAPALAATTTVDVVSAPPDQPIVVPVVEDLLVSPPSNEAARGAPSAPPASPDLAAGPGSDPTARQPPSAPTTTTPTAAPAATSPAAPTAPPASAAPASTVAPAPATGGPLPVNPELDDDDDDDDRDDDDDDVDDDDNDDDDGDGEDDDGDD